MTSTIRSAHYIISNTSSLYRGTVLIALLPLVSTTTTSSSSSSTQLFTSRTSTRTHSRRFFHSDFERVITAEFAKHLVDHGYAVQHDAFSSSQARTWREEIDRLHERGVMKPNYTHFVSNETSQDNVGSNSGTGPGGSDTVLVDEENEDIDPGAQDEIFRINKKQNVRTEMLRKHHILEAEMVDPKIRDLAPSLSELYSDSTLPVLFSVFIPRLSLQGVSVKAQKNLGYDACFPLHTDTESSVDERKITILLYLNQDWKDSSHGGQLILYPFPKEKVVIDPKEGTLVAFASAEMVHRVLPTKKTRHVVTVWLSGKCTRRNTTWKDKESGEKQQAGNEWNAQQGTTTMMRIKDGSLDMSPVMEKAQRMMLQYPGVMARVAYHQEWVESLYQSHIQKSNKNESEENLVQKFIDRHSREVKSLEKKVEARLSNETQNPEMGKYLLEDLLKKVSKNYFKDWVDFQWV